ncbi:MAG TPA: ComEC/Rec2 family competence protein [Sphingomonas sp.]|nr:ComEC/Rec2 family competence protein [Sphingomonas sp.]
MGDIARGPSIAFRRRQTGERAPARRRFPALGGGVERWLEAEREQLMLWLPVGFVAGVAGWFWLPGPAAWIGLIAAAMGLALLGFAIGRGGRGARALALFALTVAIGCALVWGRAERAAAPVLGRPQVARMTARIERVEPRPADDSVRLLLAPVGAPGLPPRLRVNVPSDKAAEGLKRGAIVAVRARLVPPPSAAVPGAYDFAMTAWFQRIGATGKALDPVKLVKPAPPSGPRDWLADARVRLSAHIVRAVPGPAGGVATALATGDMGAIPQADADAFRRSGLAHLLSVSGLHLTAVVGAVMLLTLRLLALSPWLALRAPLPLIAAGAAACAGVAYTLLTGAEVPTVRSLIAALLVLGGLALGREALTLRLVAAGALLVVLLWPESVAGASFQLSFAAILSIVALHETPAVRRLFGKREEGRLRRLARELGALLLTGMVVEAALAPIAIFHFHRAGLYGAVANLVAIPLTTFVVMPAEACALFADMLGLGAPFWWVTGRALDLLLWIAHHVAAIPGASTLVPTMTRAAFAAIMAGGLWLALWRTRARLLGLIAIAAGVVLTLAARPADIFVTGDGRHVAVRGADGAVALLRERTGDYMRDTLSEVSGVEGDAAGLFDDLPQARCGPDSCAVTLERYGRAWHVLATRSRYLIDRPSFAPACARADIVVSDRALPRWCRPRWLKADARLLTQTGGLAIHLDPPAIRTVAEMEGEHPWAVAARASRAAGERRWRRHKLTKWPRRVRWLGASGSGTEGNGGGKRHRIEQR